MADRVIKYEQLEEKLGSVLTHIGLPPSLSLPRHKSLGSSIGTASESYRHQYNDNVLAKVSDLYEQEIKHFDYRF